MPVLPLDAIVLTHAHLDHSGVLPVVVRDGFRGPIFSTQATRELAEVLLLDSAQLAVQDAEYLNRHRAAGERPVEPTYTPEDVRRAMRLFRSVDLGQAFEPAPGVSAVFREAGHILGSAGVLLTYEDGPRVYFTGDLGRRAYPILRDPDPLPPCDAVICEATYGDRDHEPVSEAEDRLSEVLRQAARTGGKVFVPAFAVGRTQNILYGISRRMREGVVEPIPIYVDSPLGIEATRLLAAHPEVFDADMREYVAGGGRPFDGPGVRYVASVDESKALNDRPGPFVVIAGSGMAEGGRIVHHLKQGLDDPRNAVVCVGYAAPHTLARRLQDGAKTVRMHGREFAVNARVVRIGAYSAHADRDEIVRFLDPARRWKAEVLLVHGDEEACLALAATLRTRGHARVTVPEPRAEHAIGRA